MYLVCVKLKLSSQDGAGDVVHEICSTHLITATRPIEAKAAVGIVRVPDGTCCRIDDGP